MKRKAYTINKKLNIFDLESNHLDIENKQDAIETSKKEKLNLKRKFIICSIITIFVVILFKNSTFLINSKEKVNRKYNYNKPFLPLNKDEIVVKKYHKTKYDSSKLRYHFEDLYKNRTLYNINYNYLPKQKLKNP